MHVGNFRARFLYTFSGLQNWVINIIESRPKSGTHTELYTYTSLLRQAKKFNHLYDHNYELFSLLLSSRLLLLLLLCGRWFWGVAGAGAGGVTQQWPIKIAGTMKAATLTTTTPPPPGAGLLTLRSMTH